MTIQRRFVVLATLLAAAVVIAGCTAGSSNSTQAPDTTAAATTTTTTTSTTTTTTLPPGLQPQALEFNLEPGALWNHATSIHMVVDMDIVDLEAEGVTVADLGDEAQTVMTTDMSGTQRTLILEMADGDYEVITSDRYDEGSVTVATGSVETKETMASEDLAAITGASSPLTVDGLGRPVTAISGAPGAYRIEDNIHAILSQLGPVLDEEPVDVGDSWSFTGTDALLGEAQGEATISDEIEYGDDDWAFVIEFEASHPDLPITMDFADLDSIGALGDQTMLVALTGMIPPGGEVNLDYNSSVTSGTVTLAPSLGIPIDMTVDFDQELTIEMSDPEFSMTIDVRLSGTLTKTFEDAAAATSFEIASVLSQFEADPFSLADAALAPLFGYFIDDPDWGVFDSVMEVLETTPTYVAAGMSAIGFSENLETWVDVFALTNAGGLRGYPELANELIWFWTEKNGREVTVAGTTAYRATVNGTEWLVWNSDTHTFVIIGPRSASASALEVLIEAQSPYLWQQGDCLEFRDYEDDVPFSPFGTLGLRHCSHGHEFEVLYSEILPDGPNEPFPDDIGERASRACGERFHDYVGVFPLESNIGLVQYRPDENEWNRGARYVACVIYLEDGDGPQTLETRFDVSAADTSVTFAVGDCLANTVPVPCSEPHDAEVTAVNQYDAPLDAEYPDFAEVWEDMDEVCSTALDDYGVTEGEYEIESGALSDMSLGWDAGIRRYLCVAGATADDGWPIDVVGSLLDEWEMAPNQFDA